jgi:hypothetical protein
MALTQVQPGMLGTPQPYNFKNRLINGAMVIDQRNNGASAANGGGATTYYLDRWGGYCSDASKFTVQQNAGSVTPPTGFKYYLGVTSSSAFSIASGSQFQLWQAIEGYNSYDLNFGTASPQTVTLSFWARSSLTGQFPVSLRNDGTGGYRSYVSTFTINSANTWEFKTITITGDTSGTWNSTNGVGIYLTFCLGAGSSFSTGSTNTWVSGNYLTTTGANNLVANNGATLYITGVQFEVGVSATTFDYRPYTTELQLCQRYYQYYGGVSYSGIASGMTNNTNTKSNFANTFSTVMRASPALDFNNLIVTDRTAYDTAVSSVAFSIMSPNGYFVQFNLASTAGGTNTPTLLCVANGTTGKLIFNAEL